MNKKEIIAALTAAGIEHDANAKVEVLRELAIANGISIEKAKADTVWVEVTRQRIAEDQGAFEKGERFETTAERAAALGELVFVVDGPHPAPAAE